MSARFSVVCDGCGAESSCLSIAVEAANDTQKRGEQLASLHGWLIGTQSREYPRVDFCDRCADVARRQRSVRRSLPSQSSRGFTLVELLVVIVIVGIVAAAALPAVLDGLESRAVEGGAAVVQAAAVAARDEAARTGWSGFRLVPDPAWPIVHQADGTLDPSAPLAYSEIAPLAVPTPYSEGLVVVPTGAYPAKFTPPPNRLVLEESLVDPEGRRAAPTSWPWNVRVGEVVVYQGRSYTVCGPTVVPIGPDNPEAYVNYGPPGAPSPLDRGAGPVDLLYLTDRRDDDGDGLIDEGWDGLDNDLNGMVDDAGEWEPETWGFAPSPLPTPYAIQRRPAAAATATRLVRLPAPVVVDATGWSVAALGSRVRSQAPVDLYTGAVDLTFDALGRVSIPGLYTRPIDAPGNRPWVHLWIADRRDVSAPATTPQRAAAVVSINLDTGRASAAAVEPTDPEGTLQRLERGAR